MQKKKAQESITLYDQYRSVSVNCQL